MSVPSVAVSQAVQASDTARPALRFLAIFAHPDDEAFSCGGFMALNKQRGVYNALICATKGEAGEISDPALATPENLGAVREQELLNAAQHMGIDELHFLGYRDSGMAGTPENQHPAAFVNADPSAVVMRLVRFIRDIKPQVILTFDPTGGYGHPDHITIHKHTVAAMHAAADPKYAPGLGAPWQVSRLFYPAFRREIFDELGAQMVAQGLDAPDWGIDEGLIPEQPIHAEVDISEFVESKWTAFKSHRTQFGAQHPFLQVPESFILKLLSKEAFELAWPENQPDQPYTDLFAGLTV
jgi:LmbE family N-acetylglucosaminyl deacetylase